ncbi:hypothetical protein CL654_01510 [bacterium]|nr:hypothetical protein [bacterium]
MDGTWVRPWFSSAQGAPWWKVPAQGVSLESGRKADLAEEGRTERDDPAGQDHVTPTIRTERRTAELGERDLALATEPANRATRPGALLGAYRAFAFLFLHRDSFPS